MSLANLPWSHNYTLIEKVKDINKRIWYAEKCLENGWSHTVMIHQIESDLYRRQKENPKLTIFKEKMSITQSELAKNMLKDPYVFELSNIKDKTIETDIVRHNDIVKTILVLIKFADASAKLERN